MPVLPKDKCLDKHIIVAARIARKLVMYDGHYLDRGAASQHEAKDLILFPFNHNKQ